MNATICITPEKLNILFPNRIINDHIVNSISEFVYISNENIEHHNAPGSFVFSDLEKLTDLYEYLNRKIVSMSAKKDIFGKQEFLDLYIKINIKNHFSFTENLIIIKHFFALFMLFFVTYNVEMRKKEVIEIVNDKNKTVFSEKELELISFVKVYILLSEENSKLSKQEFSIFKKKFLGKNKDHNFLKSLFINALRMPSLSIIQKIINNKNFRDEILDINPRFNFFMKNIEKKFIDQLFVYIENKEKIESVIKKEKTLIIVNGNSKTYEKKELNKIFENIYLSTIKEHRIKLNLRQVRIILGEYFLKSKYLSTHMLIRGSFYYNIVTKEIENKDQSGLNVFLVDRESKYKKLNQLKNNDYKEKNMNSNLHNLIKHIKISYDDNGKEKYVKAATKVLKDFAKEYLKLEKEDFKIGINRAGHGSPADVSLSTSSIYILLVPERSSVLCQKYENWKLVPQSRNNWFDLEYAFCSNVEDFVNQIKKIMN